MCKCAGSAEFTTDIQHISGKNNAVSDALSRSINHVGDTSETFLMSLYDSTFVDFNLISEAQKAAHDEMDTYK